MMKFLKEIMDWWWDRPATEEKHDYVEPPRPFKQGDCVAPSLQSEQLAVIQQKYVSEEVTRLDIVPYRPPTLDEALEIVKEHYHVHAKARGTFEGEHRGRAFTAAPNASDAAHMAPPELNAIVEMLKKRWQPFILVAIDRSMYSGAAHGWCNGSNFGRDVIHEIMRCAELNFRQELAKCGEGGSRSMPISGVDRPLLYPPNRR
jgi:hypothetical protein